VFRMLAHASLAMQTAFSCLLVCLLEFYYRRIAREAWLRWFAFSWVVQAFYVATLWIALDHPSGGVSLRAAIALLGFMVPSTIALTSLALLRGRSPARAWIACLYLVTLAAAAITFVASLPFPLDSVDASRIHNVPRYFLYGLASLLAAAVFARHGRQHRLTGSMVTAGAWAFYGLVNLERTWQWYETSTWAMRGAENNPTLIQFSLVVFQCSKIKLLPQSVHQGRCLAAARRPQDHKASIQWKPKNRVLVGV